MQRVPNIRNPARLSKIGVVRLGVKDEHGRGREVGHFMLDLADEALQERALRAFGDKPTVMDVAFFSDTIEDVFRCSLQRWGMSAAGTSYLLCEGNGQIALSQGKQRLCPCPAFGRECRKTTVLKFLLPAVSMAGYVLLSSKSEYNAQGIETALNLVHQATGGLIMRPFRLRRTVGYAEVNGIRTKKYYVSLEGHDAIAAPVDMVGRSAGAAVPSLDCAMPTLREILPDTLRQVVENHATAHRDEVRRQRGREIVREKIKLRIMHPHAVKSLEEYACWTFGKAMFDELTAAELLELWHAIDNKPGMVGEIYALAHGKCMHEEDVDKNRI